MINRYFPLVRRSKSRKSGKGEERRDRPFSLHSKTSKSLLISRDQTTWIDVEGSKTNGLNQSASKEHFPSKGRENSKYTVKKIPRNKISAETFNQRVNLVSTTQGMSSNTTTSGANKLAYNDLSMNILKTNENGIFVAANITKKRRENHAHDRQIVSVRPDAKTNGYTSDHSVKTITVSVGRGRSLSNDREGKKIHGRSRMPSQHRRRSTKNNRTTTHGYPVEKSESSVGRIRKINVNLMK